jgi:hypothetical protein
MLVAVVLLLVATSTTGAGTRTPHAYADFDYSASSWCRIDQRQQCNHRVENYHHEPPRNKPFQSFESAYYSARMLAEGSTNQSWQQAYLDSLMGCGRSGNIVFVGDSLARNQFQSFRCMLQVPDSARVWWPVSKHWAEMYCWRRIRANGDSACTCIGLITDLYLVEQDGGTPHTTVQVDRNALRPDPERQVCSKIFASVATHCHRFRHDMAALVLRDTHLSRFLRCWSYNAGVRTACPKPSK